MIDPNPERTIDSGVNPEVSLVAPSEIVSPGVETEIPSVGSQETTPESPLTDASLNAEPTPAVTAETALPLASDIVETPPTPSEAEVLQAILTNPLSGNFKEVWEKIDAASRAHQNTSKE